MKTITIAGNVGKDAQTRTAGQDTVTSFSVAVNDGWGDKKRTLWFDCSVWGKRGKALAQHLTKGTKVAALFKEISANEVKISFRARGALDVGRVAKMLSPQGGGHHRAAGCTISGTIESVQKEVIRTLQKELQQE